MSPTMSCFLTQNSSGGWGSLHSTGLELPLQIRLAADLRSDDLSLVREKQPLKGTDMLHLRVDTAIRWKVPGATQLSFLLSCR